MLDRLRLFPRLLLAMALPMALMALSAGAAVWQLHRISAANAALEQGRQQRDLVGVWIGHVRDNLDKAILASRLDAVVGTDANLQQPMTAPMGALNQAMADTAKQAADKQAAMLASVKGTAGADEIEALVQRVATDRERFVKTRAQVRDDLLLGEGAERIDADLVPLATAMKTSLDALQAHIDGRASAAAANVEGAVGHARMVLAVASLLALAAGGWLAWRLARSIVRPIGEAARFATEIAGGELGATMAVQGNDETAALQRALLAMRDALSSIVHEVRDGAGSIQLASAEVAQGSSDLSGRTEHAAARLQQATSAVLQLADGARQTAASARSAAELADSARGVAQRGGEVVGAVVRSMEGINEGSRRIADIVGTIDGIAFQTNILALNAAVEAARAGEQGRGFAVVAGEVRQLARRSAEAAKEIKALIGSSVDRVEAGSRLAGEAGGTMDEIVSSVLRVTAIIGEISSAASAQSHDIGEVGTAVNQLDGMTQQNAALVEQSTAAAGSLRDQAQRLADAIGAFRLAERVA